MNIKVCILDGTLEKPMFIFYCHVEDSLLSKNPSSTYDNILDLLRNEIVDHLPLRYRRQKIEMFFIGKSGRKVKTLNDDFTSIVEKDLVY